MLKSRTGSLLSLASGAVPNSLRTSALLMMLALTKSC